MPTHLNLMLSTTETKRVIPPHEHANGMRALLLGWFHTADSELAQALHDADQPKPYSIGPLVAKAPGCYQCRISLLRDDLLAYLLCGMEKYGETLQLGRDTFRLDPSTMSVETCDWADFLPRLADTPISWRFSFDTPTAHHQTGVVRKALVVPLPDNCFGGWWRRWNLYAPFPFDFNLPLLIEERMTIAALQGETLQVKLDRSRNFIGFTGETTFHLIVPAQQFTTERQALTALAHLAPYCGTGVDAVRGMGSTRYHY